MTAQFDLALATCTQKIGQKSSLVIQMPKQLLWLWAWLGRRVPFEVLSKLPWHWLVVP